MKSVLEFSFVACLLAVAAGCASGDDSTDTHTDPSTPANAEASPVPTAAGSAEASPDAPVTDSTSTLSSRSRRPRPQPSNPCAAVSCLTNTSCEVIDGQAVCVPLDPQPSGRFCGGFAGIECPGSGSCVDNPADDCDPRRGGADCGGICECNVLALCSEGFAFDPSPAVCACVLADGSGQECSAAAQ